MGRADEPFEELSLADIELTRAIDADAPLASSPTALQTPLARAAEQPAPPAMPRVGRYELLMELASGGMATVYVGRQFGAAGFQRLVAIKRMHPHIARDPELAASFMDEARIASLIRHPNVVNVHDVHDADGERLLVMDYVEGTSLSQVMRAAKRRKERLSRPAALRILVDTLTGLHAAHEQHSLEGRPLGVVHRDATPHNILLGVDGSVRLTDFGIAKAAERSVHTAAGLAKGKFRYMSPEQARGGALDRRCDVFALGVVAWELLTGRRLFDSESDGEVLLTVTAGNYPRPASVEPSIGAELDAIVMRALGVTPDERFPTAAAFADALSAHGVRTGELANGSDVARLVQEFCSEEVESRRRTLADVLEGRRRLSLRPTDEVAVPSGTGTTDGTSRPLTVDSVKVVPALSEEQIRTLHAERRRAVLLGVGAGALLVGAGLAGVLWLQGQRRVDEPTAVSSSAPPPPSAPVQSPRVRVAIRAEGEVTEVRGVGVDDVEFGKQSAVFSLPRAEESVTVVVSLADGSEIEETFVPRENVSLRVRSAVSPTTSSVPKTAPPGSKAQPKAATPATGLESNPYE